MRRLICVFLNIQAMSMRIPRIVWQPEMDEDDLPIVLPLWSRTGPRLFPKYSPVRVRGCKSANFCRSASPLCLAPVQHNSTVSRKSADDAENLLSGREDKDGVPLQTCSEVHRQNRKEGDREVRKYSRRKLLLGACVMANIVSVSLAVSILFPFLTREVLKAFPTAGIGRHLVVGVLFSTTTIVEAVVAPVTATDLHNAGEKNVLVLSSFLVSGSLLLFGFVNQVKSWTAFVLLAIPIRVVQGVGSGANFTAAYTLLVTTFPESTGLVNGIIRALNGFGYAVGPAVGGFLYDVGGFHLPCSVMTAVWTSVVNTILLIGTEKSDRDSGIHTRLRQGKSAVTFKHILSFPWVWMCMLLLAMGIGMCGLVESTISQFMKDEFGASSSKGGLALLLFSFSFGAGSFLCGVALDKWIGPRTMCLFGLGAAIVSFLMYGPASILPKGPSVPLTYISTVPYGMAVAILLTSAPEDMLRTLRRRGVGDACSVGAYVGAVTQVGISLFYTPGLLLGPVLSATVGVRKLSSLLAAVYFSLAIIFLIGHVRTWRRDKQLDSPGTPAESDSEPINNAKTACEQREMIPLVTAAEPRDPASHGAAPVHVSGQGRNGTLTAVWQKLFFCMTVTYNYLFFRSQSFRLILWWEVPYIHHFLDAGQYFNVCFGMI
ncbi:MFS-type transporter SLC18B1-like [Sycon ciliatum]|uniref:MFS-type transporter SLC18B1-like n=1 Tax=Sycon ciliatum TaxID=27933 RepID=UPI0031F69893